MGGTSGGPSLPQSGSGDDLADDGTFDVSGGASGGMSGSVPGPSPYSGLPGVGGTDGYGGYGRSYLIGPGGANMPHDVETASTFLAHNGFMDAPTQEATDQFHGGLEKLRDHIDGLAEGGAPTSTLVHPEGTFELLAQRAVSAGHLSAPEGFGEARLPAAAVRPTLQQVLDPYRAVPFPFTPGPAKPGAFAKLAQDASQLSAKDPSVPRPQSGMLQEAALSGSANPAARTSAPLTAIDKSGQPRPILDPLPNAKFSAEFRNKYNQLESQGANYHDVNRNQETGQAIALGRYQMTDVALRDIGMKDDQGNWIGKFGVNSEADFLKNPKAQEQAVEAYHERNIEFLQNRGDLNRSGSPIKGILAPITVTEAGLVAAAHRRGAKAVHEYLEHIFSHNGVSDASMFPTGKDAVYRSIEKRLREYQNIPLRP